ncbi:hypothetical protein K435DRAFT_858827 [Dendrothele bispora CBS 962.96]|uniref:Uncharacterized protein n=1 Tax=Dendrothele bispora (strain CBS 962.96) TaxID=1314807 RepID=A0A4V4HFT6_DENBC|nr:hypothetical protein K435DRAFT_858827 [Dendrothele bispora CBS 962.96]
MWRWVLCTEALSAAVLAGGKEVFGVSCGCNPDWQERHPQSAATEQHPRDATATPVSTLDGGAATVYEIPDNNPGAIQVDATGTHQITRTITASASGWTASIGAAGAGVQMECHQADGDTSNGSCDIKAGAGVGTEITHTGALSDIVLPIATGGSSGSGSSNGNGNSSGNSNNGNSASSTLGMRVGLGAILGGLAIGGFMLI